MKIQKMNDDFSVCQIQDFSSVTWDSEFCFLGKTDEENSLVCLTQDIPEHVTAREDGWKAMRVQGVLDFSLIGILSKIATALADNQIGIFAISTYQTDYILVKAEQYPKALEVLSQAGYEII